MPPLIPVLAGGLFTVASGYALGRLVTRGREIRHTGQFAIGSALLSLAIFFLRLGGWAEMPQFLLLGGVCCTGFLINPLKVPTPQRLPPFILTVLAIFAAVYAVYALAPEIQSDPNTYHLKPAVDAKATGGFSSEITFYDRLPQGMENLFATAYAIGGSSSAKLVHFTFLLATVPLLISLLHRLGVPRNLAAIASATYFCTPVVGIDGTSAFNDAALVFFTSAAIDLLLSGSPLFAGLCAGFCYATKMTGGLVPLFGFIVLVAFRRWRAAALFTSAAALMIAPWILRNSIEVGNPFAPVLNAWFPNPYFTILGEQRLVSWFRHYELRSGWQLPLELAIHGRTLQGMLGPAFLLAPVALLALRYRTGRILLALTVALSVPWFLNWGTRFLMPSLPFLAAAMVLPLPRVLATGFLLFHAITSFPAAIEFYSPEAWHLNGFPIAAALRIEPESDYMKRVSWDYNIARMIETHTRPSDRTLDLQGIQLALVDRNVVSDWQSSTGERLRAALLTAQNLSPGVFYDLHTDVQSAPYIGIRVRQSAAPDDWSVQEVELWNGSERIPNSRKWMLNAWPNDWFTPYAFDVNWISGWAPWQHAEPGMYVEALFDSPVQLTAVNVVGLTADHGSKPEIYLERADRTWFKADGRRSPHPGINLRRNATRFVSRAGIRYLLAPTGAEGNGSLGVQLAENPSDWGVEKIDHFEHIYLLRIE